MISDRIYSELTDREKVGYLQGFTELYRGFSDSEAGARELAIIGYQVPAMFLPPVKGDRVTGRMKYPPLVFAPQAQAAHGGYGYVYDRDKFDALRHCPSLTPADHELLDRMEEFWESNDTAFRTRAAYPADLKTWLPSDNWTGEPGIAFPLYRMSGSQPDFEKLLSYGVDGLKKRVEEQMGSNNDQDERATHFYLGLTGALDILSELCLFYADRAGEFSGPGKRVKKKKRFVNWKKPSGTSPIRLRRPFSKRFNSSIFMLWSPDRTTTEGWTIILHRFSPGI